MAPLPNFPTALLAITSLFVSPKWQAATRNRFKNDELSHEKREQSTIELIGLVQEALELEIEDDIWTDILAQIMHLGSHLDFQSLHTRNFSADGYQTFWALLNLDVMPSLGRTWGFWCYDEPLMPELPGGDLWFLPQPDPQSPDRLILPVETIARWWRNILQVPLEKIWPDATDERLRSFQNWLSGRTTPDPAKIAAWFPDDAQFTYHQKAIVPPANHAVRSLFLWARALETAYKGMVAFLTPGVAPQDSDPMRNKVLQSLELFRLAHHHTMVSKNLNPMKADEAFSASVPGWLAKGHFFSIIPGRSGPPAPERVAAFLSQHFKELPVGKVLHDVFADATMSSPAPIPSNPAIRQERDEVLSRLEQAFGMWRSSLPDREHKVSAALAQLKASPLRPGIDADITYLEALHAISKGDFITAGEHLTDGLEFCRKGAYGAVHLRIAETQFGLSVAQDAFHQKRCEAAFRVMSRNILPDKAKRWGVGEAPFQHSMRVAAAELAEEFWHERVHLYPGAKVEDPLSEQSPLFREFFRLALGNCNKTEVKTFIRSNRLELKRKLRDIRGDSFFTMVSKMVPDLIRTFESIPDDPSRGQAPSASEMAKRFRSSYLLLAELLPSDVLNAADYLNQTQLMLAADKNDLDLVQILLDRHVDLDLQDTLGRTALHSSIKSGSMECFNKILEAGANPALKTHAGRTPLVFAADLGRSAMLSCLLQLAANPRNKTEMELVHEIAKERYAYYKDWHQTYSAQRVQIGTRLEYQKIMELSRQE